MRINGLVAATFTPMTAEGAVNLDKVPDIVEHAVRGHIAALFVNGTTGEFGALSREERLELADAYVQAAAGRIPIIVHAGSSSVEESTILARHAAERKAAAVGALVPFYFRPTDAQTAVECLKPIAAACAPLPFYYYHIPSLTGMDVSVRDILPLALERISNFAGVKYTHSDMMDFQLCLDRYGDCCQMLFGRDETLLAGLALGATGAVGSTYGFASRIYHELIKAFEEGNMTEARRWQAKSQEMIAFLPHYGFAGQKAMMKFAGVDVGPARLPVVSLGQPREDELRRSLEEAGLLQYLG